MPYPHGVRDEVVGLAVNRENGVRIADIAKDSGITESVRISAAMTWRYWLRATESTFRIACTRQRCQAGALMHRPEAFLEVLRSSRR